MKASRITGLPPKSATIVAPPIVIKHCVGIDVSKDHLEVCFSQMDIQQTVQIKATRKFANRLGGWKSVDAWVKRLSKTNIPLWLVMEATGVYYEGAAYYLASQQYQVAVVLPNKSKSFIQSLNLKTKTDAMEARALAQMGLERKMKAWRGFSKTMLTLKRLCRERETIQEHMVAASNQLHAHKYEHNAEKKTLQRAQQHIKFLQKQIQDIDRQIEQTLVQDPDLKAKIDKVCTLKGVSTLTAVTIISETNGFELIENKAQLVSYAGYDVVERQSGSSIKGKTRISKKGNAHIRRALHYPALSAARYDPNLHALYQRVVERNPKAKMVALVAVQRKLLVLIYTLFKNNMEYDPNYAKNKTPIPN
ncbi:MAG: IS110 family transposase [Saprospiraceae bacterium]|nr:IS110 family transposase [Saprospiraceae bacterium]